MGPPGAGKGTQAKVIAGMEGRIRAMTRQILADVVLAARFLDRGGHPDARPRWRLPLLR